MTRASFRSNAGRRRRCWSGGLEQIHRDWRPSWCRRQVHLAHHAAAISETTSWHDYSADRPRPNSTREPCAASSSLSPTSRQPFMAASTIPLPPAVLVSAAGVPECRPVAAATPRGMNSSPPFRSAGIRRGRAVPGRACRRRLQSRLTVQHRHVETCAASSGQSRRRAVLDDAALAPLSAQGLQRVVQCHEIRARARYFAASAVT